MREVKDIEVSGHACCAYSLRVGGSLEEAEQAILKMLSKARRVRPEDVKEHRSKKHKSRQYYNYNEYYLVLNQTGTAVITLLVKDQISEALYSG